MTQLWIVRHGQPAPGSDPSLDAAGRAQARRVADYLSDKGITAIVSSILVRARETAAAIGDAAGVAPEAIPGLEEWGMRPEDMPYIPFEDLASDDPATTAIADGRFMDFVPKAVDVPGFRAKVDAAFDGIVADHPGGRVVVVCHGGTLNAYVGRQLGISDVFWTYPDYASLTRLTVLPSGRVVLNSLNETQHLTVAARAGA